MVIDELIEKANYVQFPKLDQTYREYPTLAGKNVLKLPANNMIYSTWKLNEHHYTTQYHREILYPIWADLLGFGYNPNDYYLIEKNVDEYDISMLCPTTEYSFDVECFERNEIMTNVSYERLINGTCGPTEYHNLYLYPHMCSRVVNNTINNNRKLFISGDSQMVPSIGFLAQHFKETYYFDNRTTKSFKNIVEGVEFTDILFALWDNEMVKYAVHNLNGIPHKKDVDKQNHSPKRKHLVHGMGINLYEIFKL